MSAARSVRPFLAACVAAVALAGCHSAGPYGYSRVYAPLSDEESAAEGAKEYDPVMMEREPAAWKGQRVSVFGVVKQRGQAPGGMAYLTLSVRTLATRNLCDQMDEDTCRVTVSDHEFAVLHAMVKLRPEDDIGATSLAAGSLVRVIGKLTEDVDKADGTQILQANYYRHWPRNFFVTMADRDHMRL
ncbi:MAG TPA: hypothetical protein VMI54_26840 [Polyangiaceae bacterium]|nr:hypothetical protein [Polyangiaceae bacterium]